MVNSCITVFYREIVKFIRLNKKKLGDQYRLFRLTVACSTLNQIAKPSNLLPVGVLNYDVSNYNWQVWFGR